MMLVFKNLLRHKMRNLLTVLGVAAGMATFVTVHSISEGFREQLNDVISRYRIDIAVQARGAASPMHSRIFPGDYERLKLVRGVSNVTSLVMGTIKAPENPYLLLIGISSVEPITEKIALREGRLLIPRRGEVMLGESFARIHQYRPENRIVLSHGSLHTVVGIYETRIRLLDGAAVLDIDDARALLNIKDAVSMAFVRLAPGEDPQEVSARINAAIPSVTAVRSGDFTSQLRLRKLVDTFTWLLVAITFVTGSFVVMNTLVMAVSERTREIGILMAVGWGRLRIMTMIAGESFLLALIGCICGNLAALLPLWYLSSAPTIGLGWVPAVPSCESMGASLVLSLCLGLVSAIYPAVVASRLLPCQALRFE